MVENELKENEMSLKSVLSLFSQNPDGYKVEGGIGIFPKNNHLFSISNNNEVDVFADLATDEVFCMTVVYNNKSYAWVQKAYEEAWTNWDGQNSAITDDFSDILQKAESAILGTPFDTRVTMNIDIPKDELYTIMYAAHLEDITLNKFIEKTLQAVIDRHGEL